MSVGWQRQYEVEALCEFYEIVKIFADEKPSDAHLQDFARRCKLNAIMEATKERHELSSGGNVVKDRIRDCDICRATSDGPVPCTFTKSCKYKTAHETVKIIQKHYGEEGMHFLDWASTILKKREANAACTK